MMDNNQMQQFLMQLIMQNNQMMSMLMSQMMPGQTPMIETNTASPTINFESNGTTNEIESQLAAMKAEIESLKLELAAAKQTGEAYKKSYENLQKTYSDELSGFNNLKQSVKKAEAYLGQSIEEVAAQGENLSGDDYYDEKKKEWDKEGISNKEKHDKVKNFKDVYKTEEEDPWGPMIEF